MHLPELNIRLPDWLPAWLERHATRFPRPEARMALVIGLARENVARGGGPFAAAIFDRRGELLMPAVNQVVPGHCSLLHAEMLAIALAQQRLGNYDLGTHAKAPLELVASTEPCAMCLGAVVWSGVGRLVCGARGEDAEAIGFDEGPKPADWVEALGARGIEVTRDVLGEEAAAVLRLYAGRGGTLYNPGGRQPIPPKR
jgi:tRNA(Arg) A34 adenosine deaminase TadA